MGRAFCGYMAVMKTKMGKLRDNLDCRISSSQKRLWGKRENRDSRLETKVSKSETDGRDSVLKPAKYGLAPLLKLLQYARTFILDTPPDEARIAQRSPQSPEE
jgi:hypothetical protein